jgi:murein DD-endopeptidase MepM/ murein hydrolase activator NlpD
MTRDFSRLSRNGLTALAAGLAGMFVTGDAHAGETAANRFAAADIETTRNCPPLQATDRPGCPRASTPSEPSQDAPAAITFGRAVDLSGQKPVRYLASASLDESRAVIMSSTGRLRDTVRLISPPPVIGAGDAPRGMPLRSSRLTSRFGMRHHPLLGQVRLHAGIDLGAAIGEPVHATSGGTVSAAGWQGGYGLAVRIDHGKGIETRYAHLSRLNVRSGQAVKPGEVIGFVGSTGRSTGPHLHYEVRRNGQPVDPSSTLGN